MMQEPVWLRAETSYRMYVGGLRVALLAFLSTTLFFLLGASGVVGTWIPTIGAFAGFAVSFVAIPVGMIGWLRVPDKDVANAHQAAFLRMVGRDVFRGLPPDPAADEPEAGPSPR
jgi:hypothetical protein